MVCAAPNFWLTKCPTIICAENSVCIQIGRLVGSTAGFYYYNSSVIVLQMRPEKPDCNIIQLFVICWRIIDSYFMCLDILSKSLSFPSLPLSLCNPNELKAVANKEFGSLTFCASLTATNYQKPTIHKHSNKHPPKICVRVSSCNKIKKTAKMNRFYFHWNILKIKMHFPA